MKQSKPTICHLSSVHFALDTRIFYRCCQSLKAEYNVVLIACHNAEEQRNGVRIVPYKRFHRRWLRVMVSWLLMFVKAVRVKAELYHFHDPELIPCGLLLKLMGREVIFDIHENIAEDIFDKPWIRNKKLAYGLFRFFERPACRYFQIILAETSYEKRYARIARRWVTVLNFCDLDFFTAFESRERDPQKLFYIGIILESRGILQITEAVYLQKKAGRHVEFHCVGELYSDLSRKLKSLPYYDDIKDRLFFYGRKSLEEGYAIAKSCGIGMCIIHPMSNSVESYPTKLFEYMAVGLPIITSDFSLYKSVVEANDCGFCVNPLDPAAISHAIDRMAGDQKLFSDMQRRGREAVVLYYNWETEKQKLLSVYRSLLNR